MRGSSALRDEAVAIEHATDIPLLVARCIRPRALERRHVHACRAARHRSAPPQGGAREVAADFLVAADGARSGVRRALGVPLAGQPALQHLLNIHFRAPAAAARLLAGAGGAGGAGPGAAPRPAMLYFVFNRDVVAVLVAHDLRAGEFVAQARRRRAARAAPDACLHADDYPSPRLLSSRRRSVWLGYIMFQARRLRQGPSSAQPRARR